MLSNHLVKLSGDDVIFFFAQDNVRLKTCSLAWNGFGPESGSAVADAIANNRALLELDISGNRLDYRSALSISRAIKKNEELETLRVGGVQS